MCVNVENETAVGPFQGVYDQGSAELSFPRENTMGLAIVVFFSNSSVLQSLTGPVSFLLEVNQSDLCWENQDSSPVMGGAAGWGSQQAD